MYHTLNIHLLPLPPDQHSPSICYKSPHNYHKHHSLSNYSTKYYPTQIPRRHRLITTDLNKWARVPHNINPNNHVLLAYIHGLVTVMPPNNYSRTTMNIIDHMYIWVLPAPLYTTILDNLAIFAQN